MNCLQTQDVGSVPPLFLPAVEKLSHPAKVEFLLPCTVRFTHPGMHTRACVCLHMCVVQSPELERPISWKESSREEGGGVD